MQFIRNNEALHIGGCKIQLSRKHVQTVFLNTTSSTAVVLVGSADILAGSNDNISSGLIWLEFTTMDDIDMLLEVANHMNERAIVKNLDE